MKYEVSKEAVEKLNDDIQVVVSSLILTGEAENPLIIADRVKRNGVFLNLVIKDFNVALVAIPNGDHEDIFSDGGDNAEL